MAGSSWDVSGRRIPKASRPRLLEHVMDWFSDPRVAFWTGTAILWILLLAGALPVIQAQAAPSGADPGNWLDLAWSLTGQGARIADWAYPPLAFFLLRGLLVFFQPLAALKVFGMLIWGAMATALWFHLNRSVPLLPAPIKLGLAALFSFTGYTTEMYAWGGYPQLLGMTFTILALPALEEALHTGQRGMATLAVVSSAAVIFTHHLLAAALPILWAIVFLWTFGFARGARRAVWGRFWKMSAATALLSMVSLPIYLKFASLLAGNPANPNGFSPQNIPFLIEYVFRSLAPLWLVVLALALIAPWLMPRTRLSGSTAALTLGTLIFFSFLWEVRLLQMLFAGMAFGLGILFEDGWSHPSFPRFVRIRQMLLAGSLALMLLAGLAQGRLEFAQASDYYLVVDNSMLPGMNWITRHVPPGERIAASQTQPDLLGWWIEGYSRRPTLSATDPRWLSFSGERNFAGVANQIYGGKASPEQIKQLLVENDIRWLFIDKHSEHVDLTALIGNGVLSGAFEDGRVLILKVNQAGPKA